jgi:hypothetical protein
MPLIRKGRNRRTKKMNALVRASSMTATMNRHNETPRTKKDCRRILDGSFFDLIL